MQWTEYFYAMLIYKEERNNVHPRDNTSSGNRTAVSGSSVGTGLENEDPKTQARLKYISDAAQAAGVQCELVAEHCAAPWQGILAVAQRYDARFIVMASRGLGSLGSLILGSETQKVLASADRPVLVIR